MRTFGKGIASLAIMSGLALSLGACTINIGGGNAPASDTAIKTTADSPSDTSGEGASGTRTDSSDSNAKDDQGTEQTDGASSAGRTSTSEVKPFGHWECVSVWANGSKKDVAEAGMTGDYYDFYDDDTVVAYVAGIAQIADYSFDGVTGSITYVGVPSDDYDEVFEISPTTDGKTLAMKIHYKGVAPENFRVYKLMGDAPDISSNSDLSQSEIDRHLTASGGSGTSSSGSTSTGSPNGLSDTPSGSDTSSTGGSGSSYDDSDTPAPGTVINGWKWV